MENINSVRAHNTGFKTLKGTEVGQYAKVEHEVTRADKKALKPAHKVVYAMLKAYKDKDTDTTKLGMDKLRRKTGYTEPTVNAAIKALVAAGFITYTQQASNIRRAGRTVPVKYNVYSFTADDSKGYERATQLFLENPNIDKKEREFILLLQEHILPNDTINYTRKEIATKIGLTTATIKKPIDMLIAKGYWVEDLNSMKTEVHLTKLQLEGAEAVKNERNKQALEIQDLKAENARLEKELRKVKINDILSL